MFQSIPSDPSLTERAIPQEVERLISPKENLDRAIVNSGRKDNDIRKGIALKLFAFFSLILVQGSHTLFFKLSQIGGKYEYNTASAIATTEFIKLSISTFLYYITSSDRTLPDLKLFGSYTVLAIAYAINNQLAMYLLTAMGTGHITLGKSVSPMLTALIMWTLFKDETFSRLQFVLFAIITMGLISLFSPSVHEGGIPAYALAWLVESTFLTTVTGVINCRILQKSSRSLHMQNMLLYSQGFLLNLVLYFTGLNATGKNYSDQGYFDGYAHVFVICVIISQSFMGIVMSAVYKYGDAIIKCLAVGVQASVLLVLDHFIFGYELKLQSIMGAGIVLVATYCYFSDALPMAAKVKSKQKGHQQPSYVKVMRLSVLFGIAATVIGVMAYIVSILLMGQSN
ncbi:hypothetical protein AAMO2058_000951200 [Amorphochlora amoebiformis]